MSGMPGMNLGKKKILSVVVCAKTFNTLCLQTDFSSIQVPQSSSAPASSNRLANLNEDPAMIRDMLLANPDQLALLQQSNPTLADAVLSGSLGKFLFQKMLLLFYNLIIFRQFCKCAPTSVCRKAIERTTKTKVAHI
jgi:hypothetical protein